MRSVDQALLDDLLARVGRGDLDWESFRPGVDIHRLWGDPAAASAVLLRYAPGASVPAHRHEGTEHIHVLSGSQRDERGLHVAGAHVVNPPGSVHQVESPSGCVVLAVWERPNTFIDA